MNPKGDVWKFVKSKRNANDAIPDIIGDNNYAENLKGKAEQFNNYFESVFLQSSPVARCL